MKSFIPKVPMTQLPKLHVRTSLGVMQLDVGVMKNLARVMYNSQNVFQNQIHNEPKVLLVCSPRCTFDPTEAFILSQQWGEFAVCMLGPSKLHREPCLKYPGSHLRRPHRALQSFLLSPHTEFLLLLKHNSLIMKTKIFNDFLWSVFSV